MKHRKPTMHVRLGPVSKAVLAIVAVGVIIPALAILPALPMAIAPFIKRRQYTPKTQAVQKTVASLIQHGLVKRTIDAQGCAHITLTSKGRWEYGIRKGIFNFQKKEKWDGKWRVIVFDIPEEKRKLRGELRHAVRLYGFVQLQKSVWIYPYPCEDFIVLLQTYLEIRKNLVYATVTELSNEIEFRQKFKL